MSAPAAVQIPFTKEKFVKLQEEKKRLLALREEISARVKTAREMGDLSENGAYHYGKFELASVSRQLRAVIYQLTHGVVMQKSLVDVVGFDSTVTLRLGDKEVRYTLVSQYESDPKIGKISIEGPLGSALMGKKVGDSVRVQAPVGEVTYTILALQ